MSHYNINTVTLRSPSVKHPFFFLVLETTKSLCQSKLASNPRNLNIDLGIQISCHQINYLTEFSFCIFKQRPLYLDSGDSLLLCDQLSKPKLTSIDCQVLLDKRNAGLEKRIFHFQREMKG